MHSPSKTKMDKPERHADARAFARIGMRLTRDDRLALVALIERREGVEVIESLYTDQQGTTLEKWLVRYKGTHVPIVYDPARRWIVSVLPKDYQPLRTNLGAMLHAARKS